MDNGQLVEVRHPDAKPVELVVVEEAPPTPEELNALNLRIQEQLPNARPLQAPFAICIREIKVRRVWGIDRRVVMDQWFHHWKWKLAQHYALRRGVHRVWLTGKSIAEFESDHHHHVVGQPPVRRSYSRQHVHFFRLCYRIFVPELNVIRFKLDQLHMVLPEDPDDPNSPLMLLTTESDENQLFRNLSPGILAGNAPDPLPVNADGLFVETLVPVFDPILPCSGSRGAPVASHRIRCANDRVVRRFRLPEEGCCPILSGQ